MEEELSLDNILGAEEIENLFVEDEDTQETPPANGEPPEREEELDKDKKEATEVVEKKIQRKRKIPLQKSVALLPNTSTLPLPRP